MQYQSDYVLRLIEQLGGLVRRALEMARLGSDEEPYELADEAIALALDVDPALVARLAPGSLAALLDMRNLDDRVVQLVYDALMLQADVLERSGELVDAGVRREQAQAVERLLDPGRAN